MNRFAQQRVCIIIAIAACGVLTAGGAGLVFLHAHTNTTARGPMLLAPMIGVFDSCVLEQEGPSTQNPVDLQEACTGPNGSAAALVESTLSQLHPRDGTTPRYPLGYTLPVPLLQLFRQSPQGWVIDSNIVNRLVRTVRDTDRSLILYLFSTHFATNAPLEMTLAQNPINVAQTRDGPLPQGRYYGTAINNWNFASTQTELTQRRVQAAQALLSAVCHLSTKDIAKIKGVTLLGELHHLFPDFEAGMGFGMPYRVTDYSPQSAAGFRQFLREDFQRIEQLNRVLGSNYSSFDEVQPPSRDIRTEPLQHFTEHIDSFAHGSLPIAGWAYINQPPGAAPAWVHVYRNGMFVGKTKVNHGRQDVLAAKPEFVDANTGWRLDMDFRNLSPGLHRIDVFLERVSGRLTHLGMRQIAIMDRQQNTPHLLPIKPLPTNIPSDPTLQAHIDMPVNHSAYFYNPLVPLWHAFRGRQVVDYLKFFNNVINGSCLANTPHYTHQIIPFTNPSWDAKKYAIQASLLPMENIRLGVSLYGDATYGTTFSQWYKTTIHRGYGITEFHPLKALGGTGLADTLKTHEQNGAEFLSFFLEPRWNGTQTPRIKNIFSFDPENKNFNSNELYKDMREAIQPEPQKNK